MNPQEFNNGINRLKNVFGDRFYPDERVKLFWKEVNQFDNYWWTNTIDYFIGNAERPPLLPQFRDKISEERSRIDSNKKRQHTEEAHVFMKSVFSDEDHTMMFKTIREISVGALPEAKVKSFISMVNNVIYKPN